MNLLAVDTSGPVAGVALLRDGRLAYEGAAIHKMTHSANLMPMVEEALVRVGLEVEEIDLYAAVTGPGSFTGVRIGVGAVRGMAHGAGKPCVGVDALEALAAGVCAEGALICPLQDARAGQVYAAAFGAGMPPLRKLPNQAVALRAFLEAALTCCGGDNGRPLLFVGDGVSPNREAIAELLGERALFPPEPLAYLRPACVAFLALANAEKAVDYLSLQPQYLRAPQAERARQAWKASQA